MQNWVHFDRTFTINSVIVSQSYDVLVKNYKTKKWIFYEKKETYVNENMAMPCLDYLWNENNKIWINPQPYTWREIDFKYEV